MQNRDELKELIGQLDRVSLAQLPTPLQKLDNLSKELSGPTIYMKREDLTGLAFGGNKTRMMEFRLPPALKKDADVIVTGFGVQSNHSRQIVAAARKFGLDVHLISRITREDEEVNVQGNLLIDLLAGASVEVVDASVAEQSRLIKKRAKELREDGRVPYVTGYDDEDLSAVSYVNCGIELQEQIREKGVDPDYIFLSSEGATQAGLLLFSNYVNAPWDLIGVNPVDWVDDIPGRIGKIANKAADTLGLNEEIQSRMVQNLSGYVGEAYGKPTEASIRAVKLVAETEGILLDPIYSGKAMAGLIDKIGSGMLDKTDEVVFVHTGGFPLLFAHASSFDFGNQLDIGLEQDF